MYFFSSFEFIIVLDSRIFPIHQIAVVREPACDKSMVILITCPEHVDLVLEMVDISVFLSIPSRVGDVTKH